MIVQLQLGIASDFLKINYMLSANFYIILLYSLFIFGT
jgi:hypothetical protein